MKKDIKLTYLKKSKKFLDKHKSTITEDEVDELILKFIKHKFYNIDTNIDYKQLKGISSTLYRLRKGNVRIIISIIDNHITIEAIVEDIGFRGDIYK